MKAAAAGRRPGTGSRGSPCQPEGRLPVLGPLGGAVPRGAQQSLRGRVWGSPRSSYSVRCLPRGVQGSPRASAHALGATGCRGARSSHRRDGRRCQSHSSLRGRGSKGSAPPATGTQPARRARGWVSQLPEGTGLALQGHPLHGEGGRGLELRDLLLGPSAPKAPDARWAAAQKMLLAPSGPEAGQRSG